MKPPKARESELLKAIGPDHGMYHALLDADREAAYAAVALGLGVFDDSHTAPSTRP